MLPLCHLDLLQVCCYSCLVTSSVLVEISSALYLGIIYFLINSIVLHQFLMSPKSTDPSFIHNNDTVSALDTGNTLSNDQLGGIRYLLCKSSSDTGICGGIHRTCGIVQNQHPGLLQQGPGNAEPLFLPAGYIYAALAQVGVKAVGHPGQKFVRTGGAAGGPEVVVRRVGIAPFQVVADRAGEEQVLSSVASSLPHRRLSLTVPEKSVFF